MTSTEIRKKFLEFFEKRGHRITPSSSLVPDRDISVLFTTAGMQQFKPYYLGEKSPYGDKVVSVQKCMRTSDIDEVGDATHLTFFEMLGNFAFNGGVSKKEVITWAYEFITCELGLLISYVTFYEGLNQVPRDNESEEIWYKLGVENVRPEGADVFWGPTGNSGPCGPTTEIYCKNAAGQDVEVWNIVFNQFFCDGSRIDLDQGRVKLKSLPLLGIDTGMGFERLVTTAQNKHSLYETDIFTELLNAIPGDIERSKRIIADHVRASAFLIADGVRPSNVDRGYVLRRLIRRAVTHVRKINTDTEVILKLIDIVVKQFADVYAMESKIVEIKNVLIIEINKFKNTLEKGLKELEKLHTVTGHEAFTLFSTYGFPLEMTLELAHEKGIEVDKNEFAEEFKKHQEESRKGADEKFKGGLADHDSKTVRLHTAHHLLLAALQKVLGPNVKQRGSNITQERLRIDFSFDRKLTDEEKKKIEDLVNQKIKEELPVERKEMSKTEAEKIGAEMEFGAKYKDNVSVYFIGAPHPDPLLGKERGDLKPFSIEFCGGPHVVNTRELGHFKIQKEEAVASGIRRIKAVLE